MQETTIPQQPFVSPENSDEMEKALNQGQMVPLADFFKFKQGGFQVFSVS